MDGFRDTWKAVLDRFFARYNRVVRIEINDAGATPGIVHLRPVLRQNSESTELQSLTMLQLFSQAVDLKVDRHFGEGQWLRG